MSNSVGRNDNFLVKARKLSILPTSLDIFDIPQHYIRILYVADRKMRNHSFPYVTKSRSKARSHRYL